MREDHQNLKMMNFGKLSQNQFQIGEPKSRLLNNDRQRPGGMQRVNLNVGGKRASSGIRDDESLLCPTPPNKELSGVEFQAQDFGNNNNIKFY